MITLKEKWTSISHDICDILCCVRLGIILLKILGVVVERHILRRPMTFSYSC